MYQQIRQVVYTHNLPCTFRRTFPIVRDTITNEFIQLLSLQVETYVRCWFLSAVVALIWRTFAETCSKDKEYT